MFDVKISANTPAELAAAVVALAAALQAPPASAVPAMPPPTVPAPALVAPPVTAVTPPPATAAVSPLPPTVPVTNAPAYTHDQLKIAGAALVDAGKLGDLIALLGAFGVQTVDQLRQDQLGAVATELRRLGAQI